MTSFSNSPQLLKHGIVLKDPVTSVVRRIIALQYNSDRISRALQVHGVGGVSVDRSEVLRLEDPPVKTIKVEAEIDVIHQRHLLQASLTTELTRQINNGGLVPNLVEGVVLLRMSASGTQLTGSKPNANRPAKGTIGIWRHRS